MSQHGVSIRPWMVVYIPPTVERGVNVMGRQKEAPGPVGLERRIWQLGLQCLLARKVVPVPMDRGVHRVVNCSKRDGACNVGLFCLGQ